MTNINEMVKELLETGKVHTVIQQYGLVVNYTKEVIKAIAGGSYNLGKTLVTVSNDSSQNDPLGTVVELNTENFSKLWLTIKAPICKKCGKDLLGTIKIAFMSFSPFRPRSGSLYIKKARLTKKSSWHIPTESSVISVDTARAIYAHYFNKGAKIHVITE